MISGALLRSTHFAVVSANFTHIGTHGTLAPAPQPPRDNLNLQLLARQQRCPCPHRSEKALAPLVPHAVSEQASRPLAPQVRCTVLAVQKRALTPDSAAEHRRRKQALQFATFPFLGCGAFVSIVCSYQEVEQVLQERDAAVVNSFGFVDQKRSRSVLTQFTGPN